MHLDEQTESLFNNLRTFLSVFVFQSNSIAQDKNPERSLDDQRRAIILNISHNDVLYSSETDMQRPSNKLRILQFLL